MAVEDVDSDHELGLGSPETPNADKVHSSTSAAKSAEVSTPRLTRRRSKSRRKGRRVNSRGGSRSGTKRRSLSRRLRSRSRKGPRRRSRRGARKGRRRALSRSGRGTSPQSGSEFSYTSTPPVPILGEGESSLISCHITELEITLYRPLPDDGKAPLFFDTTACLFREYGKQIDYVGVGRSMTNDKSLVHRTHDVVFPGGTGKSSRSLLRGFDDLPVVAGDTVVANMKKVSMYAGFSMCATLFTKELPLCEATGVYYTVKKANEEIPLAVIPVEVKNSGNDSCIVLMIRKRKGCTETAWELVRLGESLAQQDVKSIVKALQSRGLVDPPNYTFDLSRRLDDIFTDNGSDSADSLEEPDDHEISREWKKSVTGDVLLESLCNKPRVKREGRRQYSVGRSAVNLFVAEGDSSDDDEVMEDALRAVVPKYTDSSPVRYDEKTYNIGSCSDQLTQHYVSHREEYGLMAFEADSSGQLVLPSVAGSLTMDKRRMSLGETGFIRPAVPPELSSTFPFLCRRRVISRSKGGHTRGRSPKKRRKCKSRRRKGRRSKGRRSASRSSSCGSNKVKDS